MKVENKIDVEDMRREDGTIDARKLQSTSEKNLLKHRDTITPDKCTLWRSYVLLFGYRYKDFDTDHSSSAFYTHINGDCQHDLDAPAVRYSHTNNEYLPRECPGCGSDLEPYEWYDHGYRCTRLKDCPEATVIL